MGAWLRLTILFAAAVMPGGFVALGAVALWKARGRRLALEEPSVRPA